MIIISIILFSLAALCNALMDVWMVRYMNLPVREQNKLNSNWWSFNPRAKWKNGIYNSSKANNIILSRIGIKTTLLSDNCNDAWHTFKSLMIILISLATVLPLNIFWGYKILFFVIYGYVWIITFNNVWKKRINKK